jgi:hypothetical protein
MSSGDVMLGALQAARKGWPVVPLRPHTRSGYFGRMSELATLEPRTICLWWGELYPDAWIQAYPPSHIVRVDVDRHDTDRDGEHRMTRWRAAGLALPETLSCQTPRGGTHHYLTTRTAGLRSHPICADGSIELKTGIVILPPSPGYNWNGYGDERIAELPRWVVQKWSAERQRRWRESGPAPDMPETAELVDRITTKTGSEPRMRGAFGSFRCPAHTDRSASAWIRVREPVRVGCSAGCTPAAILSALGLEGVAA